jgi:hypothetical protein
VFELVEEPFYQIALAIERGIDDALLFAVARRGDAGPSSGIGHQREQGVAVIGAVADDDGAGFEVVEQFACCATIVPLAGGQDQADGQAALVDDRIDLGAQSPTRTTDGVIRTPFFAPAACWCARMIELSIRAIERGLRAASASNTRSQMPAFAQRLKRL